MQNKLYERRLIYDWFMCASLTSFLAKLIRYQISYFLGV